MHVAVAIVGFRNAQDIATCLHALSKETYREFEVVICENGGEDSYRSLLQAVPHRLPSGQEVKVICASENLGYGGGVNVCIRATPDADAWWVLNPDTVPDETALEFLVGRLRSGDCELVGGVLYGPDDRIQTLGGRWHPWLARAEAIGRGTAVDQMCSDQVEESIDFVSGASMLVSRRFVEATALMREDYFLFCEEVEWCLRGRANGMRIGFARDARVLHHQGSSTGSGLQRGRRPRLQVYLDERNKVLLTADRYPKRILIAAIASLLLILGRYGRLGTLRQLNFALAGWWAGLRCERGNPSWPEEPSKSPLTSSPQPAATLAEKLAGHGHKNNGFDTIRLIAAVLVLVSHSFPIGLGSNEHEPLNALTRGQTTLGGLSVAVFFFISGLLISNSFEASSTIAAFVGKRALRIMPALIVVCLVLTFVMGPLFTALPLSVYFRGAWRFLENAVFMPTDYALPGVFSDHPVKAINGSLWSLKFEVACYAAAALMLCGARGRFVIAAFLWLSSFCVARALTGGSGQNGPYFYIGTLAGLYRFFGAGVLFYIVRDRLRLTTNVAWAAFFATVVSVATPYFMETAATCGAYALLVFAYECPRWFRAVTARGDISYGTYVYAFPTEQVSYSIVGAHPWLITVVALPVTLVLATLSWSFVERPALKMKRLWQFQTGDVKHGTRIPKLFGSSSNRQPV